MSSPLIRSLCVALLLTAAGTAWAGPQDRHGWHHVQVADGGDRHAAHTGPWRGVAPAAGQVAHSRPPHGYAPPPGGWHHQWGGGNPYYFPHHDWYYWHRGYWHQGWYGPRFGWWWVVSGVWFYYPAPVYPYPNPYVPSGFAAPPPPAGSAQPATQYWYYCPAANGYYPYISECPSGWQQVLPTPHDADKGEVPGG